MRAQGEEHTNYHHNYADNPLNGAKPEVEIFPGKLFYRPLHRGCRHVLASKGKSEENRDKNERPDRESNGLIAHPGVPV
jgi:hypothetical protein